MTQTTVTNSATVTLLAAGASRWVTIQNQSSNSLRIKHDATGDAVSATKGTILKGDDTLLIQGAPAASEITAIAIGGSCDVCVQTGSL